MDQIAAVVVQWGDRVLLLKRAETLDWSPGKWCFPSGHVNPGETVVEAAVRETREEAGLTLPTTVTPLIEIDLPGRHVSCFYARVGEVAVTINKESTQWAWVSLGEVSDIPTTPEVPPALKALTEGVMAQRQGWARKDFQVVQHAAEDKVLSRVVAKYKSKKEVRSEDGGTTTIYEYSDRQIALRNTEKAKRIEALRGCLSDLRSQVQKDLKSSDPDKFLTALAVALMDETYERVGNEESAGEGHFGITGWRKNHVSFNRGKVTVSYVGKSGVKQKKVVSTPALVKALRDAYEAVEGDDACLFCHDTGKIDGTKINAYLKQFKVTTKDIRGYHANDVMKQNLKKIRKGELPANPKERKEQLKEEFKKALETTAKEVGHEPSTLRSQYLVPGLEDDYMKGEVTEKMIKSAGAASPEYVAGLYKLAVWGDQDALGVMMAGGGLTLEQREDMFQARFMKSCARRIAFRYAAQVVQISGPWVDKMRKDFLALMKNLPRVKDYKTAHKLRNAFSVYNNHFDELLFKRFLNKGLKYDNSIREDVRKHIDRMLRKSGWDLHIEMSLPIGFANDYWSPEQRFIQYERDVKPWEKRVRRKAQIFWKAVHEAIEYYEDPENKIRYKGQNESPTLQVEMPASEKTVLEGFQLIMQGYDPSDDHHRQELEILKEGLKTYRQNAAKRLPILLQKQLPVIMEFEVTLDKGGTYNRGTITLYASSVFSKGPNWVAHVMAHEMGHHIWQAILSASAKEFWTIAIKGDYGDLDIQHLVNNWPGDSWAFEFSKVMGQTNPLLALQVEALSHDISYGGGRDGLQTKEDFQKLIDQGQRTLRVPKTPISGYANKNPEEAFCEAIGLLVTYGPRAVNEKVRDWLNTVLLGQVKLAKERQLTDCNRS